MPDFQQRVESLAQADAALQLALEGSGVGFWYYDLTSGRAWQSAACREMHGHPATSADVEPLSQLHPDDAPAMRAVLADIADGRNERFEHECRVRHADGGHRWTLIRGRVAQRDARGQAARLIGVAIDVHDRHQAELGRDTGHRLLEPFIESIPAVVFWKDHEGIYRGCNTAFARLAGRERPGDLVGRSDADLGWDATTLASIQRTDALILDGKLELRNELRNELRDFHLARTPRACLASTVPLRDTAGRITGLIGVVVDVTEMATAREALRRAEQRFELALERSGAAVWDIDIDIGGGVVHHSPRLAAMLGYGPHALDLSTDHIYDAVHPDDLMATQALRQRIDRGETDAIELEYRVRRADGGWCWLLSRGAVVERDANGRPLRLVGTHTDITDEYEGRDRAAHARQLESLGNLAAGVAHEINTPLQFVSDSVGFLRTGVEDIVRLASDCASCELQRVSAGMPRALELVQQGIMRIAEIVRGMRVFAHPDSRAKEPARLDELLRSALAVARHECKHVAGIRTEFAELPPVPCHPGELSQVFVNVIVNAAHAIAVTGSGGATPGQITLRILREGDAGVVEIEDTGCGIEAAHLERIFEPFYTTKPLGQGTGQGLAIARTVIEQHHGGRISASSRPGHGTTIRIQLPLKVSRDQVAA